MNPGTSSRRSKHRRSERGLSARPYPVATMYPEVRPAGRLLPSTFGEYHQKPRPRWSGSEAQVSSPAATRCTDPEGVTPPSWTVHTVPARRRMPDDIVGTIPADDNRVDNDLPSLDHSRCG